MNTFSLTFLGTGTSVGVPIIGCDCEVCLSNNFKNKRLRSSVVFKTENTTILIDSGPDLRQQALRANLVKVDAVLYTHSHLDHVAGFDELRAFCWHRSDPLPLYGNEETLGALNRMYPWAFNQKHTFRGYIRPEAKPITDDMIIGDFHVQPIQVEHGSVDTHGYVLSIKDRSDSKRVGYISDFKTVKNHSLKYLEGLDTLILDGLRYGDKPHPTHSSVEDSINLAKRLDVKKLILTHLSHEVEHEELDNQTPDWVRPAYDEWILDF